MHLLLCIYAIQSLILFSMSIEFFDTPFPVFEALRLRAAPWTQWPQWPRVEELVLLFSLVPWCTGLPKCTKKAMNYEHIFHDDMAISKCEAHRIGPAESLIQYIVYTRVWLSMHVFYRVMHVTCFCRCEDYASCRLIDSCRIANAFKERRVVLVLGVAWTDFHRSLQPFSKPQVISGTYSFIHLFHLLTCSR